MPLGLGFRAHLTVKLFWLEKNTTQLFIIYSSFHRILLPLSFFGVQCEDLLQHTLSSILAFILLCQFPLTPFSSQKLNVMITPGSEGYSHRIFFFFRIFVCTRLSHLFILGEVTFMTLYLLVTRMKCLLDRCRLLSRHSKDIQRGKSDKT